jgi:hypothetical protein
VKFETTTVFDQDWRRLADAERDLFRRAVRERFNPACNRRALDSTIPWPAALRVKPMKSRPEILEMTWERVDGRATFEWIVVNGEPRIRWRRIGGHAILGHP